MAMKVTCMQEKDGTRRVVTEKWEMLFQPLNSQEDCSSMEQEFCELNCKVIYVENGTATWLGDAKVDKDGVAFFQQDSKISNETAQRVIACNEILWQMEQLGKM